MHPSQHTARTAGVLFLITFVSAITGAALYAPLLTNPGYVAGPGADTRILWGAVCELVLIIANIGTAVVLFPVLKRTSETAAVGYLAARIMECALIAAAVPEERDRDTTRRKHRAVQRVPRAERFRRADDAVGA